MLNSQIWIYISEKAKGKENAITSAVLGSIFNMEERQVRKVIQKLRNEGKPIAASVTDPKGYYIPVTPEERLAYARQLESRIRSMVIAYRSATRTMPEETKRLADQLSLDLGVAS